MTTAGKRAHRVTFQRATTTVDDYGGTTHAWADQAMAWVEILWGTGRERREAAQEAAVMPATFIADWNPTLATLQVTDRIVFDGANWDITSVAPIGFHKEIHFTAVRSA